MIPLHHPDLFKLPKLDAQQRHYVNEAFTRCLYQNLLRPGDTALDLGANLGGHTRSMAICVGPTGCVHAFEPNRNLMVGLASIAPQVRVWPFAVGDRLSVETLTIPNGLEELSAIIPIDDLLPNHRDFSAMSTVQLRLDDLPEIADPAPAFIKIDVERREAATLRGMRELLTRARPPMVLENATREIDAILAECGYVLRSFNGGPHQELGLPNVICWPSENLTNLARALPTSAQWEASIRRAVGA